MKRLWQREKNLGKEIMKEKKNDQKEEKLWKEKWGKVGKWWNEGKREKEKIKRCEMKNKKRKS